MKIQYLSPLSGARSLGGVRFPNPYVDPLPVDTRPHLFGIEVIDTKNGIVKGCRGTIIQTMGKDDFLSIRRTLTVTTCQLLRPFTFTPKTKPQLLGNLRHERIFR